MTRRAEEGCAAVRLLGCRSRPTWSLFGNVKGGRLTLLPHVVARRGFQLPHSGLLDWFDHQWLSDL